MDHDMGQSTSGGSAPLVFKTSDGKVINVVDDFKRLSLMLADLLQLDIQRSDAIDLPQVHSQVLEQINSFVERLTGANNLKGQIPWDSYEDGDWTEFTTTNLRILDSWLRDVSTNMLIRMANAGQYMQMKAVVHPSLAVLAERAKKMDTREELRQFLNESDEMDNEMLEQLEKVRRTRPDF